MTTKRSAAAATIRSRVCAPPPPLTSQPTGVDLVGPVDGEVEPIQLAERRHVEPVGTGRLLGRG